MQNCNRKINLALLALIAAGLLAVPPEIQAQEPNFAWITDTNGITWREKILPPVPDPLPSTNTRIGWLEETRREHLILRNDKSIAEVVVPEHARIGYIDVRGCVNLTNLIIKPKQGVGDWEMWTGTGRWLTIYGGGSGLRNITAPRTMINRIGFYAGHDHNYPYAWVLAIQWTELELPKIEIRTQATANGTEVEVVWRDGKLQIADAVNGKWKDYSGDSPLRFPLWLGAKPQQFFRIRKGDD